MHKPPVRMCLSHHGDYLRKDEEDYELDDVSDEKGAYGAENFQHASRWG